MLTVRDVAREDEPAWLRLWLGYLTFYEAQVPDGVTAMTWERAFEPRSGILIRLAALDGAVVGFSASVLHPGTWTVEPTCYLEDLFVDPAARGRGAGRRLIQDLVDQGKANGWARLYWHTRSGNAAARGLYDRFCLADDFVRYRMTLSDPA